MEIRAFLLDLCREADYTGVEHEIVEEWEADHGCCCMLQLYKVSQGDRLVLNIIRRCMGLRLMQ